MRLRYIILIALCYSISKFSTAFAAVNGVSADYSKGAVRIGQSVTACTSSIAGAIRFNSSSQVFEGCTGFNWCALPGPCNHPGPTTCPNPGNSCPDGSYYIGRSKDGTKQIFMTQTDTTSSYQWSTSAGTWQNGGDANDGKSQSASIGASSANPSAYYCEGLTLDGKSDWYLPATYEMNLAVSNASTLGLNLSGTYPSGFYWTSTETDGNNAVSLRATDGYINVTDYKTNSHVLRCVRQVAAP